MLYDVACMVAKRDAYRILVGKWKGMRPVGRTRHSWNNNVKIDLRDWVVLTGYIWLWIEDQWRTFANTVMSFVFTSNVWKFLSSRVSIGLCRRDRREGICFMLSVALTGKCFWWNINRAINQRGRNLSFIYIERLSKKSVHQRITDIQNSNRNQTKIERVKIALHKKCVQQQEGKVTLTWPWESIMKT